MGKAQALTKVEQGRILALHEEGKSVHYISSKTGRSRDCIRRFLKDLIQYNENKHTGRPPALSSRDIRAINRCAATGKYSSSQIKSHLQLPVSSRTIRNILSDTVSLQYKKRKQTPVLTNVHKDKRIEWATDKVGYGEKWQKAIFSDEKKFNLDGPDGWQYYWADLRKEPQSFFSRHSGGGGLMVWVAISYHGKSKLAFLEGKQDSEKYIYTLSEYMLPFAHLNYGTEFEFQQDNCSIHKSHLTNQFFEEMNANVMEWPALSPDLNQSKTFGVS